MKEKTSKKKALPLLVIISAIIFTGFIGAISFTQIFPTTNPFVTNQSTINISYGIHAGDGLSSITHSWNGTNTTLWDYQVLGMYNFNNFSTLGENITFVQGIDMYNSNLTINNVNITNMDLSNITWIPNSKYGGAYNFSGKSNSMNLLASNGVNLSRSALTISIWFKPAKLQNSRLLYGGGDSIILTLGLSGTSQFSFKNNSNNVTGTMNGGTYGTTWTNFVYTYNGSQICAYKNSVQVICVNNITGILKVGTTTKIGSDWDGLAYLFNGTMDDLIIWNRSLSQAEINEVYNLSLTKYNSTYFEYNTTQIVSNYHQPYFLCSTNLTGSVFCSGTKIVKDHADLTANFSTSIRIIPSYFYGVNADYGYFNNQTSWIKTDNNLDGTVETVVDKDWNKEVFQNSKMNLIRMTTDINGYYLNTTDNSGINVTSSYSHISSVLKWAYENNITLLVTIRDVPSWLLGNVTGTCYSATGSNCTASNYTKYANMINDMTNRITAGGLYNDNLYYEFYSEPSNKWNATIYISHFNDTWNALQIVNPNIKLIGPAVGLYYWNGGTTGSVHSNFLYEFARNVSGASGISIHMYLNDYSNMQSYLQDFSLNCTRSFCSNLFISETNVFNITVRNTTIYSSDYGKNIGTGLITGLNYPNLTSFDTYEWSQQYMENQTVAGVENSWFMVTQPELVNSNYFQFKPSFNVTSAFAHLCPSGATVSVSSSDDLTIKQVSCKKGNMYSLIVINTDTNAKNVTANLSQTNGSVFYPYTSIMNYETGSSIPVSSGGIIQLGVIDPYEIVYLSEDNTVPTVTINTPTSPTGDVESLSLTITLSKAVTSCSYTLNNGASQSMTNSGLETEYYAVASINKFTNTFVVTCTDIYGNVGTATTTVYKTGNELSILNEEKSPFMEGFRFLNNIGVALIVILIGFVLFTFVRERNISPNEIVAMIIKIVLFAVIIGVIISVLE